MIVAPLNDRVCLGKLTELAADGVHRDSVRQLAARFYSTTQLVRALRIRPQREDLGNPLEQPKVACDVPQRARMNPADPNCFERTLTYLAAAELIDPRPIRQMATVEIPGVGRHTFPLEDGRPVILDPLVTRNMLNAGLYLIRQAQGAEEEPLTPQELINWVADLAEEEARQYRNGAQRMASAHAAIDTLLAGEVLSSAATRNLGWALALANRAAPMFGQRGIDSVKLVQGTLAQLARRNLSIRIGKLRIRPDWGLVGRTVLGGASALGDVGKAAAKGVEALGKAGAEAVSEIGSAVVKVGGVAIPVAAQVLAAKHGIPPVVVAQALGAMEKATSKAPGPPTNKSAVASTQAANELVKLFVRHPALMDPKLVSALASFAQTK